MASCNANAVATAPCATMLLFLAVGSLLAAPLHAFPYLSLDEGDACVTSAGVAGTCRRLRLCLPALDAVRRRHSPSARRCGFVGWEEVVCCPALAHALDGDEADGRDQRRPSTTTTTEAPRTDRPIESSGHARRACQRYRNTEEQRIGWFILGGEEVSEGEFPHMVALGYLRQGHSTISWRCGGTLLSERWVLTAAHCLTDRLAGMPKLARVGEVDLRLAPGGPGDYSVERAVLHPRYKRKFNYDDVGLLRLAAPVAFSQNARPACLPQPRAAPPAGPAPRLIAIGWGATDALGSAPSPVLLKTNLSAVPLSECRALHRVSARIPQGISDDMLCAGDPSGRADTCVGDSGGPLQVLEEPRSAVYTVVGITSFGPDPCGGKKPGVYVRVANYVPWIESVVWD